jgi:hypothetical protein
MKQELQLWCYDTNGNASIIDLYENENMYLQFQFNDLVDFTNVGNYSREFRIPASKTNIDFFGAIFNVNYNGWFDFRKKVDASIVVNTIPITTGHIQIKQIFESKEKLHEFQIVFFDPNYFIFNIGISMNRYIVSNGRESYVKKELDLGFLLVSLRFSWLFEDDSKMQLKAWNKFNCEGNSFMDLKGTSFEALSSKKIKAVRFQNGRTMDSFTYLLKNEEQSYFLEAAAALNEKRIIVKGNCNL